MINKIRAIHIRIDKSWKQSEETKKEKENKTQQIQNNNYVYLFIDTYIVKI